MLSMLTGSRYGGVTEATATLSNEVIRVNTEKALEHPPADIVESATTETVLLTYAFPL